MAKDLTKFKIDFTAFALKVSNFMQEVQATNVLLGDELKNLSLSAQKIQVFLDNTNLETEQENDPSFKTQYASLKKIASSFKTNVQNSLKAFKKKINSLDEDFTKKFLEKLDIYELDKETEFMRQLNDTKTTLKSVVAELLKHENQAQALNLHIIQMQTKMVDGNIKAIAKSITANFSTIEKKLVELAKTMENHPEPSKHSELLQSLNQKKEHLNSKFLKFSQTKTSPLNSPRTELTPNP